MAQVGEVMSHVAPLLSYILPALSFLTLVAFADAITSFIFSLINPVKKRIRF